MTKSKILALTALCLGFNLIYATTIFAGTADMSPQAIQDRIAPVSSVYLTQTPATTTTVPASTPTQSTGSTNNTSVNGEAIYQQYCATCHAEGLAGAPKFKDSAAWKLRMAQGVDVLVTHAINGYKLMPPKGTCMTCTDAQIKAAVTYMTDAVK